ncbi:unnamed protein product [Parnassius apollo]|uniref:(apollo) hypothetical protein n=1 Tax=Parnassius apollo TaxID=110799 RepID=A0A8S3VYS6_PARAO|nr:unnamed protein product [Parnassius apollo]
MKSWLFLSIVTLVSAGEQLSTSNELYKNPTVHILEQPQQVQSGAQLVFFNTQDSVAQNGSYSSQEAHSKPIKNQDFNLTNLSVNVSSLGVYESLEKPTARNTSYYGAYHSPVTNYGLSVNTNNSYPTKYSDTTYSSHSINSSKPVSNFNSNFKTHSNLVKKHTLVSGFTPYNYRYDAPSELEKTYGSFPNALYSYVSRPTTYFSHSIKDIPEPYSGKVTTYESPSVVFSTPSQTHGPSFQYSKPVITDFQSNIFTNSADSSSFPKTYLNTVSDSSRLTTFSSPATPVSYFKTYSTPATPTSYFTTSTSPTTASNLKTYSISSTPANIYTVLSTPSSSTTYLKQNTPSEVFFAPTENQGSSFHYSKPVITDFQSNIFLKSADYTSFPKAYFRTVSASPYPTAFSTPATPVSYFKTYSTPATPTSHFKATSTSPETPAPTLNLNKYSILSTPASFTTVYSTPSPPTSYFEYTTPAPPVSYYTTSKPEVSLPTSYSTVTTGQDYSSSTSQPVTLRKIASVTVLNPETTYRSASSSTDINATSSTPVMESTTYSTLNAANYSDYATYSKPIVLHSSSSRTYSVPLSSFSLLSRTNSIPVTHVTRLSGYSTTETPISDKTVYSTPVPISYSTVYSTPVSHVTPVNTHFLNPTAYSKIVDNQVASRPVYSVPVSSYESSSFNAGPSIYYGSSPIYSIYPPSSYAYTVQRAPVTKEYHTLETPIDTEHSLKTIDTWNVLPEQHFINA